MRRTRSSAPTSLTPSSASDVYAVQGWDTTQLLDIGLKAVGGDVKKQDALYAACARRVQKPARAVQAFGRTEPDPQLLSARIEGRRERPICGGDRLPIRGPAAASPEPGYNCARPPLAGEGDARGRYGSRSHPVAERRAVWTADFPRGDRTHARVRHHGRDQSLAWLVLHARRLWRADAHLFSRRHFSLARDRCTARFPVRHHYRVAVHSPSLCARPLAAGAVDLRAHPDFQRSAADSLGQHPHSVPIPGYLCGSIPSPAS